MNNQLHTHLTTSITTFTGNNRKAFRATVSVSPKITVNASTRCSRYESIARHAQGLSPARLALLGLLLRQASPADHSSPDVLQPLWANEAMQRAYDITRLISTLDVAVPISDSTPATLVVERRVALKLAATYGDLAAHDAGACVSCSSSLHTISSCITSLFGLPFGPPRLQTNIQDIWIPAFQRRALVLATSGLLMNAFTDPCASVRDVEVELFAAGPGVMRLTVVAVSSADVRQGCEDNLEDLVSLLDGGFLRTFAIGDRIETQIYFRAGQPPPAIEDRDS